MNSKDALDISRDVAESVRKAVIKIAGKKESGETVGIGKLCGILNSSSSDRDYYPILLYK